MASRRSRLSVKPNLGSKPGGRGGPAAAVGRRGAPQASSTVVKSSGDCLPSKETSVKSTEDVDELKSAENGAEDNSAIQIKETPKDKKEDELEGKRKQHESDGNKKDDLLPSVGERGQPPMKRTRTKSGGSNLPGSFTRLTTRQVGHSESSVPATTNAEAPPPILGDSDASEKLPGVTPIEGSKETIEATDDGAKMKNTPAKPAIRRSRFPRVKPNLGEAGRHRARHTSLTTSEAEEVPDLSKRAPPAVQRTASLEVASALVPEPCVSNAKGGNVGSHPDTGPQPTPPDGAVQPPTPEKVTAKKPTKVVEEDPPKRKRRKRESLTTIDRSKLTMRDLIYMNPVNNPMKSTVDELERQRKKKEEEKNLDKSISIDPDTSAAESSVVPPAEPVDQPEMQEEENQAKGQAEETETNNSADAEKSAEKTGEQDEPEDDCLVPQVRIGPDGNIILNQASLVLDNPNNSVVNNDMELVMEKDGARLNASSYGRKKNAKLWTQIETKKFYLALSAVGTDFSLMDKLFPKRSRTELKRKFKREEKVNKYLIEKATSERQHFDMEFFETLENLDHEAEEEIKAKELLKEKKARKQKAADEAKKASKNNGNEGVVKKARRNVPKKKEDGKKSKPKKKKVPTATLR